LLYSQPRGMAVAYVFNERKGSGMPGAEGVCLFHEDLKKRVEKHDEEIGEIKERLASGDEKLKTLDEIKRGQAWAVQLTIGTLITVVMTLFAVLFKLKGG
jgi:hypothetical protein